MVAQTSPAGSAPAGHCRAAAIDFARPEPSAARTMGHRHDARAEELDNLRLALATFALQLDVFEMRTNESLRAGVKPQIFARAPDGGRSVQKEK
jgi:hypothetical protein